MSMAPLEIKPKFQVTVLVLGSMGNCTATEPMDEMMLEQVLCSVALWDSSVQKKSVSMGTLGTKHLQPESACVDGFGIAKQEPLGEVLEVTLKTSPGMLVSSILASPASKEEFNYILYNKDYQNAGNHLFSKILLPLTLHNHASCLPNRSKWPGHPPLVPELCSPCLNFPAMHFWWIQGTGPLCFMTVANIILSAVIILHGKGIHGSSISGLSVAYLHLLVKCLMLNLSIGHLKFCSIQKSECPKAAG